MKKIIYEYNQTLNTNQKQIIIKGLYKGSKIDSFLSEDINDSIISAMKTDAFDADYNKFISIYTDTSISKIILVGLGKKEKLTNDKLRSLGAKISSELNVENLSIDAGSFNLSDSSMAQVFSEGLVLGTYKFLNYKSKKDKKVNLEKINFIGDSDSISIDKGRALGYAVHFSRDLGNHPANILTPEYMADLAVDLSDKCDLMNSKIIDVKDFVKLGLGSFYSVAKASVLPAKMILIEYNGGNKDDQPLALVGKGLTFDTGGISLKPPARMDEMKFDMCGSGTVLGVMNAVVSLRPKLNIIFAIGATENMPGGNASRPGDIVTAYNGKTIEVLNTDAEGRLVLADVLSYVADKYKPEAMIDFATLTGAVLVALGHRASGLMGNDEKLINNIKKSSEATDEKVWELPLWPEYSKDIKGKYADIQNIGKGGAGTITAGAFLKEFVGDTPWCHLDIAGTAWGPKDPGYQPKIGATGVAVRMIYNLIENKVKN